MSTPMRLANKTIATLEDIITLSKEARADLRNALRQAKKSHNPNLITPIASAIDKLANIETKAITNRHGGYDG